MFHLISIPSNPKEQISKEGDQAKSQKSQRQSPKEGGNEKVTRQPEKEESIGQRHIRSKPQEEVNACANLSED